jgi:NTE family protein
VAGGAQAFLKLNERKPPRRLVIVSVNASTDPEPEMDVSNKQPSLEETIDAVTDVQLHRYNAATLELMDKTVPRWAREVSTPGRPMTPYFIQLSFWDIIHPEKRRLFNRIPTSFSLTDEQVDTLVAAGHDLLRNNPDYQRFVADLGGARASGR